MVRSIRQATTLHGPAAPTIQQLKMKTREKRIMPLRELNWILCEKHFFFSSNFVNLYLTVLFSSLLLGHTQRKSNIATLLPAMSQTSTSIRSQAKKEVRKSPSYKLLKVPSGCISWFNRDDTAHDKFKSLTKRRESLVGFFLSFYLHGLLRWNEWSCYLCISQTLKMFLYSFYTWDVNKTNYPNHCYACTFCPFSAASIARLVSLATSREWNNFFRESIPLVRHLAQQTSLGNTTERSLHRMYRHWHSLSLFFSPETTAYAVKVRMHTEWLLDSLTATMESRAVLVDTLEAVRNTAKVEWCGEDK